MKLDNEQKVLLCQKALYAKQLVAYANLCQVYKTLAEEIKQDNMQNASSEVLAAHVQKYYGPFLAQAAQGDLSFIEQEDGPIFNKVEQDAFISFAKHSMRLEYFREAAEVLFGATHIKGKDGSVSFSINEKKMDKFDAFLNPPKELFSEKENIFFDETGRTFGKMIAENPKRWIGHKYYKVATNALKVINEVDSNHISSLNTKNVSLSPKSFGATITGARGNITPIREFTSPRQEFRNEIKNSYTDSEHSKYSQPVSHLEDFGARMYGVGHNVKEKAKATYTAHKGTLKKALKLAGKITATLGVVVFLSKGIQAGIDAHTLNQLSADTNAEQGYHVVVTQDTLDRLNNIDLMIDEVENSTSIPSTQQLYGIRDELDEAIDLVVEDLVRESFEEKYPNLSVQEVETHYDKSHADERDGRDGNYIYITCQDKYGKEYKYTVTHFTSQGENRTDQSFDNEYDLDHVIPGEIADTASGPYKERTESVGELITRFKEILQDTKDFAGVAGSIDIPQAEYDNAKVVDKETIVQRLKVILSKYDIKPSEFRLVATEKIQNAETNTPIIDSAEHDDR